MEGPHHSIDGPLLSRSHFLTPYKGKKFEVEVSPMRYFTVNSFNARKRGTTLSLGYDLSTLLVEVVLLSCPERSCLEGLSRRRLEHTGDSTIIYKTP